MKNLVSNTLAENSLYTSENVELTSWYSGILILRGIWVSLLRSKFLGVASPADACPHIFSRFHCGLVVFLLPMFLLVSNRGQKSKWQKRTDLDVVSLELILVNAGSGRITNSLSFLWSGSKWCHQPSSLMRFNENAATTFVGIFMAA